MERLDTYIGSRNASLEETPEILKAIGMHPAIHIGNGVINDGMSVILSESAVRRKRIGVERRASFHMLADFGLQCSPLAARYDDSANRSTTLQHSHDGGLIFAAGSGDAALALAHMHVAALATDESFVGLDFAAQLASKELILHGETDAVEHEPCCLLRDLHVAGDLVAADPILAIGEEPGRGQPLVETDGGILHHGSNLDRKL